MNSPDGTELGLFGKYYLVKLLLFWQGVSRLQMFAIFKVIRKFLALVISDENSYLAHFWGETTKVQSKMF